MNGEKRTTVLVVDDEPSNLSLLQGILAQDGYRLVFATNGGEALEVAHAQQPDIILLDIMMPQMDGYEVCRRLHARLVTRDIPVIFITAMSDVDDEAQGLQLGAVDYITKPVHAAIVRERVKNHLKLSDVRRAAVALASQRGMKQRIAEFKLSKAIEELLNAKQELEETQLLVIQRLGRAAEYKDNETGLHVIRMSHYSSLLAHAAGMGEVEAEILLHAAPMHDIGKIGIPDRLLLKPGDLDDDEWRTMRKHPEIGAGIIGTHDSVLLETARLVALTHHERWSGEGYPHGLKGEDIPLIGRIVAIVDVFDALTSKRPYKEAWTVERSRQLLQNEQGKHFDPELVHLFLQPETFDQVLAIKKKFAEKSLVAL